MIAKKIEKNKKSQSLHTYVKALITYISSPQNKDAQEKCILYGSKNIFNDNPQLQIEEIVTQVRASTGRSVTTPLAHWVLSVHENDKLSAKMIPEIVEKFMLDLGYIDHQYVYALHSDTDNLHMHIIANRMNLETGKILQEGRGWWKKESRKACCRIEKEYGFIELENSKVKASHRNENIEFVSEYTGEIIKRKRPVIVNKPIAGKGKIEDKLRSGAIWNELITGKKSKQRILQEILTHVYAKIDNKMKFGDIYSELASHGVQCAIVKHGQNNHITFSLDGINFEKASKVCPDFNIANLENLTKSGFRKPRFKLIAKAERFREHILDIPLNDVKEDVKNSQNEIITKQFIKDEKIKKKADFKKAERYALINSKKDELKEKYIHKNIENIRKMHANALIRKSNHVKKEMQNVM